MGMEGFMQKMPGTHIIRATGERCSPRKMIPRNVTRGGGKGKEDTSREETIQGGFVIKGGFGECTLVPVFGTVEHPNDPRPCFFGAEEHPPKLPFGNHPFADPRCKGRVTVRHDDRPTWELMSLLQLPTLIICKFCGYRKTDFVILSRLQF